MTDTNNTQNKKKDSGFRTLLLSACLSSTGPLILGLGLLVGRSSTQISDFVRRTAETLGIILALVIYVITTGKGKEGLTEEERLRWKEDLEKKSNSLIGVIMCISGLSMLAVTFFFRSEDKGNVIPALCISSTAVIANGLFWRKYASLYKKSGNAILGVQARLYRAKALVDTGITIPLAVVAIRPGTRAAGYLDTIGSVLVSAYMIWCGIRTIRENIEK